MKRVLRICSVWVRWLVFVAMAAAVWSARSAVTVYTEPMTLYWGKVQFVEEGTEVTDDCWYARQPPTFARDGVFRPEQQQCLSNSFLVCTGKVGQELVWRIDSSLSGRFKERAQAGCVAPSIFTLSPPPTPWQEGPKTISWTLRLRCELLPVFTHPSALPSVEMALLVEEIPPGVAWEISIPGALSEPLVQRYAQLTPTLRAAVATTASWASLYLIAPGSLQTNTFPVVQPLANLKRYAAPVAFGLVALAEVSNVLGTNRGFSDGAAKRLRDRLSPDTTNAFPRAHYWFPEPEATWHQFDRLSKPLTGRTAGPGPEGLLLLSWPTPGKPYDTARVLTNVNEWAIRIGPFRRVTPPLGHVDMVRGKTTNHPVETLPALLAEQPRALEQYRHDIGTLESNIGKSLGKVGPGRGGFFWLPSLVRPHQLALRTVEKVRFTDGIRPEFQTNHFVYLATYAPALVWAKMGISYNPEHRLGSGAEGGWTGLLRPGDVLSGKVSVAERAVDGELSYILPYQRSLDNRTHFQIEAFGQASKDEHFRLGSLSGNPFHHQEEDGGLEHVIRHRAQAWEWTTHDAVFWDAHKLDQPGSPGSRQDSGLLLRHRELWQFTPDTPEEAPLRWEYTIAPAFTFGPGVGWDHSFFLTEVSGGARATFGGEDHAAMYAGMRGALGATTDRLPPSLLYRLGDTDRLYGLEPGEFSGRSYAHGEAVYGLSLSHLLGDLFQNKKGESEAPDYLDSLHLQAIAEIGAISIDHGIDALSRPDKIVSSYGVALEKSAPELRGAAFRIGYAWSPDSLRSSGRVFTGLSWGF